MSAQRTIFTGGTILTMDSALGIVENGDLLIEGDKILDIGRGLAVTDAKVVDARHMIVSPGFVDTHRHVWQTQLRTVATNWSLFNYFTQMRSIYSGYYQPNDAYLGNLIGALEAIHAGITTIVDHSHIMNSPDHSDEAVRGLQESGIRGIFCYGLFDNPESWSDTPPNLPDGWRTQDAHRIRRDKFSEGDLLQFGLAPSEVVSSTIGEIAEELELARQLGSKRISCHVSMGQYDTGIQTVRQMFEAGLLADDLLFVHGSTLTDDELKWMADSGAALSVTPETELQMAMGHPCAVRAMAAGVQTSLGIDIVSSFSGDMQSQMRLLLQAQRGFENNQLDGPPQEIRFKAKEVLDLATLGGAKALGWEANIGSLKPGKQADIVLTNCSDINMVPVIDPVGALVLNANPYNIDSVYIAGRVVKEKGQLVDVNWSDLVEHLRESSSRIRNGFLSEDLSQLENLVAPQMLR